MARSTTTSKSVTVNGRTVTDPKQVASIERNRQASATYATQAYQREGTPIPAHLRSTVEAQIAAKGDAPARNTGGTGALGLPDPMSGGRISGIAGLNMGAPSGQTGPNMFSRITGGYTGLGDMVNGGGPNAARAPRATPTAGPNTFAGLGAPGERSDGLQVSAPTTPVVTAPPVDSMDSGNLTGEEASRINAERSKVPTYEAGGMVGPNGVPQRPSTVSLDLPPALARMLSMPTQSYAEGGMVGPGGMPQRPPSASMASPMAMNVAQQGGAPVVGMAPPGREGRPLNFAAIDQQAQQFMQQNPQQVAQIRAEVEKSMAEGEVDAQGLNTFVQVATAALQNPEMWPQLRQVLIRQGMLDAEDVGEEYDQGFLIILYIIGKTMGSGQATTPMQGGAPAMQGGQPPMQGGQPPMSAGQAPQMSMSEGGALPEKSENEDGSIPINAHEGEYVIPADVTRKLGTDHFDRLIAKARGADGKGEQ